MKFHCYFLHFALIIFFLEENDIIVVVTKNLASKSHLEDKEISHHEVCEEEIFYRSHIVLVRVYVKDLRLKYRSSRKYKLGKSNKKTCVKILQYLWTDPH